MIKLAHPYFYRLFDASVYEKSAGLHPHL